MPSLPTARRAAPHTHLTPYTSIKLITDTSGRRVNYVCLEPSQGATGQPLNYQHGGIRSGQRLNHCAKYKHINLISWLLDGCVLRNNRHKASEPKGERGEDEKMTRPVIFILKGDSFCPPLLFSGLRSEPPLHCDSK